MRVEELYKYSFVYRAERLLRDRISGLYDSLSQIFASVADTYEPVWIQFMLNIVKSSAPVIRFIEDRTESPLKMFLKSGMCGSAVLLLSLFSSFFLKFVSQITMLTSSF